MERDNDIRLSETALRIYVYLLGKKRPVGPRQIFKDMNLSSPSVAYYHLERLRQQGLLKKTTDGYVITQKINIEGFIYIGKKVIPRLMIYSMFLLGLFIIEILVLYYRIKAGANINIDFIVLIIITSLSSLLMLVEGILMYLKVYK